MLYEIWKSTSRLISEGFITAMKRTAITPKGNANCGIQAGFGVAAVRAWAAAARAVNRVIALIPISTCIMSRLSWVATTLSHRQGTYLIPGIALPCGMALHICGLKASNFDQTHDRFNPEFDDVEYSWINRPLSS
jgi:hypothetical protein